MTIKKLALLAKCKSESLFPAKKKGKRTRVFWTKMPKIVDHDTNSNVEFVTTEKKEQSVVIEEYLPALPADNEKPKRLCKQRLFLFNPLLIDRYDTQGKCPYKDAEIDPSTIHEPLGLTISNYNMSFIEHQELACNIAEKMVNTETDVAIVPALDYVAPLGKKSKRNGFKRLAKQIISARVFGAQIQKIQHKVICEDNDGTVVCYLYDFSTVSVYVFTIE